MGLKLHSNKIPITTVYNLPASVDEGQSISPVISFSSEDNNIINSDLSANIYWEISGVGIASTDFENVGADGNPDTGTTLTGYVNLTGNNRSKQFAIGIRSDNFTDLNVNETATFSIYSDSARTDLIQSDTFIINDTSMGEPEFDFLIVGGGGKGGFTPTGSTDQTCTGGGGAGGVLVVSNEPIGIGSTIYCGIAATQTTYANGNDTQLRQDTSSGTILHYIKGGGKGASEVNNTYAGNSSNPFGGSGGGGAGWYDSSGGTGGIYGNNGGNGGLNQGGGGGGGYGSAGGNYVLGGFGVPTRAGHGGNGYDLSNFFSELEGTIAGGGGGGGWSSMSQQGNVTSNGAGVGNDGGGDGGYAGTAGSDADDNTGGGGGGASPKFIYNPYAQFNKVSSTGRSGGDGGSGVVYLKYIAPESLFTYTGNQTVNSYIISVGGGTKKYWVHKLTTSGTLTRVS